MHGISRNGPPRSRRRPTIPLVGWRIALDLAATRAARTAISLPPCGRRCPLCRNWAVTFTRLLPEPLQGQMRRLGIDPARPSDLYASLPGGGHLGYRVTYHCVGRILSGPATHVDLGEFRRGRWYEPLRRAPDYLSLSVAYDNEVYGEMQARLGSAGPVVQVDFRLDVPWVLDEPYPA